VVQGNELQPIQQKITMNHTHNNGYDICEHLWGNIAQNIDDIVGYR
jgi:hypothetical protein